MKVGIHHILLCCFTVLCQASDLKPAENSGLIAVQQKALIAAHSKFIKRLKSQGVSAIYIFPTVMQDYSGKPDIVSGYAGRIDKSETALLIKYLESPLTYGAMDAGFSLTMLPLLINCPTSDQDAVEMEVFDDDQVAFRIRVNKPIPAQGDFILTEEGSAWLLKRLAKK